MKFTKHTFLMLGLASVLSLGQQRALYATYCNRYNSVSAGEVCLDTQAKNCQPGCYCTGGNVYSQSVSMADFKLGCKNRWSSWNNHAGGWTLCPADFPNSPEKASKPEDCYAYWGDDGTQKVNYHSTIKCNAGYYAPAKAYKTEQCKDCATVANMAPDKYCPGSDAENGGWYVHSFDYGIKTCPTGKRHTADFKDCEPIPDVVSCSPGAYLPANSETCTPCLDGRVCPGALDENGNQKDPAAKGEYVRKLDVDQGLYFPDEICKGETQIVNRYKSGCDKCGTGYKANDAHTECVDAEIEVEPGKYLPANRVQEVDCIGTNKFCPGGKFWKKDFEQGRYDCPTGFEPKKSAGAPGNTYCEGTMSKNVMKEGFSGNGKCWQKTDPADYRYCIYGVRFELPESDE